MGISTVLFEVAHRIFSIGGLKKIGETVLVPPSATRRKLDSIQRAGHAAARLRAGRLF